MIVIGGDTNVTAYFQMRLTAGGDGTVLTIADFDLSYTRSGAATSAKVDAVALALASTPHTDNRGIEVDPTDCPGLYRFDFPDAAFAAGVREVILTVKHASAFTESLRVEINVAVATLTGHTAQTGDNFARLGAPAGADLAADIATVDTVADGIKASTDNLPADPADQSLIIAATDAIIAAIATLNDLSAAQVNAEADTALADYDAPTKAELDTGLAAVPTLTEIVDGVLDEPRSSHLTAGSIGEGFNTVTTGAVNDVGASTTVFVTNLTEVTDDHWKGLVVVFLTGALAGQGTSVTAYNGTTKALTVAELTEAPANGVQFVIG